MSTSSWSGNRPAVSSPDASAANRRTAMAPVPPNPQNQAARALTSLRPSCRAAAIRIRLLMALDVYLSTEFEDTAIVQAFKAELETEGSPPLEFARNLIGNYPPLIEDMVHRYLSLPEITSNDIAVAFDQLAKAIAAQHRLATRNAEKHAKLARPCGLCAFHAPL